MKALRFALSLVGLLAALPASAAPKHILISDSLLANADKWNVKRGAQWLGIRKWRFGDYSVVVSTSGTRSGTRTNLLETKTETRTGNTFSFVLNNETSDSAFADAVHQTMARSQPGLKVGDGWTVGGDDRVHESDLFTAIIAINRDTMETWTLSIGTTDVANRDGDYGTCQRL